ncbi:hypothetical protein JOH50_001733 [Rhizobium leguminosarum]|nr:hypothetical protein [Rhizobium leguminosarum]
MFVELFLEAHAKPRVEIVLDLDATDDPLHGLQEGPVLSRVLQIATAICRFTSSVAATCLSAKLRRSNIDASRIGRRNRSRRWADSREMAERAHRLRPRQTDGLVRDQQGRHGNRKLRRQRGRRTISGFGGNC